MTLYINDNAQAQINLAELKPDQNLHSFKLDCLYENGAGKVMGARFISEKHGFIIDLMQIQSVPQGFFWVKTPPATDMGESHTCEHLLLGKGSVGRYVSALENMSLGSSSAYTAQTYTAYHFNTVGGEKAFYTLFREKLNALLNPDFTDEEIRREVCHIGYSLDPRDSSLKLEEKGTVYTEMVSSFERPSSLVWKEMSEILYGTEHPLGNTSGGYPPAIREMTPEDLREFHNRAYYLGNMGAIVSIPDDIDPGDFLKKTSAILDHCQPEKRDYAEVGISKFDFPPPAPKAEQGEIEILPVPSNNPDDPAQIMFIWPASLKLDNFDSFMLDLFLSTFASGTTSNLYNLFINSQTRAIDLGTSNAYGYHYDAQGNPIVFGLEGVRSDFVNADTLAEVRNLIKSELEKVHSYADASEELKKFNEIARSHLTQSRKQVEKYLNSPPMFGFRRSSAGGWYATLEQLEKEQGFRKSMVFDEYFKRMSNLLDSDKNIWRDYIQQWKLIGTDCYVLGTSPSPEILEELAREKENRIKSHLAGFRESYNARSDMEAIAKFKEDFDANTAELERLAENDEIPEFIENPPMTVDDQLNYAELELAHGIPMVASTFDNMTTSTYGIAFRLDVIPEKDMLYLSFLPSILTSVGVIKDGEVIPDEVMRQRLREEVISYNAYTDYFAESNRVEIVLKATSNNIEEIRNGLDWMTASLTSPYLEPENLPRLRDLLDQSLVNLRNVMKGREEDWVRYPAAAYRYQDNPVIMSTDCFLTKSHNLQRLRWKLAEPGNQSSASELEEYIDQLAQIGIGKNREELKQLLDNPPELPSSDRASECATLLINSINNTLADIPDGSLSQDYKYLLMTARQDLLQKPEIALEQMKTILATITRADNARMFMISSSMDRQQTLDDINAMLDKLDNGTNSVYVDYRDRQRVVERLATRVDLERDPVYVGLVNENTHNGVMVFSARHAESHDTDREAILRTLSGKLFSGAGGHGLFMRTWGAGLAYSNGYSVGPRSGRVSYYAERCPDIAQTMRFVVDVLKNAEDDPELINYAIAQIFDYSRSPSRYETRGEAMASDLVDGYTPDKERNYRERVLEIKESTDLASELFKHMEDAYGPVLIGYGKPLSQSQEGTFFIIGPEKQFKSLEEYIGSVEEPRKVHKLYPRDFWLTI